VEHPGRHTPQPSVTFAKFPRPASLFHVKHALYVVRETGPGSALSMFHVKHAKLGDTDIASDRQKSEFTLHE